MFICYKCGYKDLSDGNNEGYCPICGTDNTIPKCSLILFLLLVSFIIVTFASFNNDDLHSIILMLLVLIGIFIPLAIIENEKRSSKIIDGFKIPDTPNDIIKQKSRVPNFEEYIYVAGMNNDKNLKKIGVGVLLGLLNSFDIKDRLVLEIQFLEDGGLKSLFITENKNKLNLIFLDIPNNTEAAHVLQKGEEVGNPTAWYNIYE